MVNTDKQPLLGREWIRQLHINFSTPDIAHISTNTQLVSILQKYSAVFEKDMGKMTGLQSSLKLKKDTQPFFIKARKVPYALLTKVENELDHLEKEGVLEKVTVRNTRRQSYLL